MNLKFKSIIFLFSVLIITIPLYFYFRNSVLKNTKTQTTSKPILSDSEEQKEFLDSQSLSIPSNLMGFSITPVNNADSSIEQNAFYFDLKSYASSLKGWKAKKDKLNSQEFISDQKLFRDYLDSELTRRGFSTDIEMGGKTLQPLTADGPGGRIWGYVKRVENKFQIILIQEIDSSYKNEPIYSLKDDCPCNLSFNLLFSDVFNIDVLK